MIMKLHWLLLVALGAVLALGCLAARADELADQQAEKEAQAFNSRLRSDFQLPKVFDFQRFKDNFGKHYSSALEEMVRAKLFMAQMYRAFISAVKYKYRAAKYFLSVNSRTDWTEAEFEASRNHLIMKDDSGIEVLKANEKPAEEDESVEPLVDPSDLAEELRRIHEQRDEPGYRELDAELAKIQAGASSRPKREAAARRRAPRADFDLSATYDRRKVVDRGSKAITLLSNNPNYEQPEFPSQMSLIELGSLPGGRHVMVNQIKYLHKPRDIANLPVKGKYVNRNKPFLRWLTQDFVGGAIGLLTDLNDSYFVGSELVAGPAETDRSGIERGSDSDYEEMDEDKPDVVWVDHRQGGCMQPVQDQGRCGSCWAFASIAFLEWAHCNQTGSPLKFSEQYLVDCSSHLDGFNGCDGAVAALVSFFVHNYGLELARHYPYVGRQEQCPYDELNEPQKMGYIRVDSPQLVEIPLEAVEEFLPRTPLIMSLSSKGDFNYYGGGIYDGRHCDGLADHGVLLIGHGREDGEEYWLIRNSWASDWGEKGYVRLNKNTNCVQPRQVYAFGLQIGNRVRLYTQRNWRIPEPIQKRPKVAAANRSAKREIEAEAPRAENRMQERADEERKKRTRIV